MASATRPITFFYAPLGLRPTRAPQPERRPFGTHQKAGRAPAFRRDAAFGFNVPMTSRNPASRASGLRPCCAPLNLEPFQSSPELTEGRLRKAGTKRRPFPQQREGLRRPLLDDPAKPGDAGTMIRAWIMVQDGKPLLETSRRTRPEAQQAWERSTRPADSFTYHVKAHRVRIAIEDR